MERNELKSVSPLDVSDAFKAYFTQQRDPRAPPATTPLHVAVLNGDILGVDTLVTKRHIDVSAEDTNGYTALHHAALLGRERIVAVLVDHGARVEAVALDGNTPLHKAAQGGHIAVAKALIHAGADPNALNSHGDRPIDMCASRKHTELTALLRDYVGAPMIENAQH